MTSLGEQFPIEQERVREVLRQYEAIGPSGQFGALFIRQTLKRADQAAISGDVVEMIRVFQEMKEIE